MLTGHGGQHGLPAFIHQLGQFSPLKPQGCESRAGSPPRKAPLQKGYAEADDLPAPVCIGGNGDCGRYRDDPAVLLCREVSGVQPEIGPLACPLGAVREALRLARSHAERQAAAAP